MINGSETPSELSKYCLPCAGDGTTYIFIDNSCFITDTSGCPALCVGDLVIPYTDFALIPKLTIPAKGSVVVRSAIEAMDFIAAYFHQNKEVHVSIVDQYDRNVIVVRYSYMIEIDKFEQLSNTINLDVNIGFVPDNVHVMLTFENFDTFFIYPDYEYDLTLDMTFEDLSPSHTNNYFNFPGFNSDITIRIYLDPSTGIYSTSYPFSIDQGDFRFVGNVYVNYNPDEATFDMYLTDVKSEGIFASTGYVTQLVESNYVVTSEGVSGNSEYLVRTFTGVKTQSAFALFLISSLNQIGEVTFHNFDNEVKTAGLLIAK